MYREFESRRHNSVFLLPESFHISSPQKEQNKSTNLSMIQNHIKICSNSIFAYQEFDHFSFFGDDSLKQCAVDSSRSSNSISDMNDIFQESTNTQRIIRDSFDKKITSSQIGLNTQSHCYPTTPTNTRRSNNWSNVCNFRRNSTPYYLGGYRQSPVQCDANSFYQETHQQVITADNQSNQGRNSIIINSNTSSANPYQPTLYNVNPCPHPLTLNQSKEEIDDDKLVLINWSIYLKDQLGCRKIQDKLQEKSKDIKYIALIFNIVQSKVVDIINDRFGNYVIQKLFQILIQHKHKELVSRFFTAMQYELFSVSINNFGTRVIQKAFECWDNGNYALVQTDTLDNIIILLVEKHLLSLCSDKNGNHVFQKIIRIFPKNKNAVMFKEINKNIIRISKLKQGAIILQTVLSNATQEQKDELINTIINNINELINDEYGNYIIQLILEVSEASYTDKIMDYICTNFISLSKKKFSSNVIDKIIVLENSNSERIHKHMIDNELIAEMISDQFGNYVVQKVWNMKLISTYHFMMIIKQIQPAWTELRSSAVGRKIYERWISKYGNYLYWNMAQSSK